MRRMASAASATSSYDVVVAGGGVVGCSVAYHAALADPRLKICVVERDPTYARASAQLSAGGIRQQFSLAANIQLSLYGIDFLRSLSTNLHVPGEDPPDVQFKEQGYLFLASDAGEETLRRNHTTQAGQGVSWTTLLSPSELSHRFPWLNTDGVALGCLGEHSEGWFDPSLLVNSLRAKARHMGVTFLPGTVSGLDTTPATLSDAHGGARRVIQSVRVATPEGGVAVLDAGSVVNCAGAFAADIVRMCNGEDAADGEAEHAVMDLPVRARKRAIFSVRCDASGAPDEASTPLVVSPSGVYFRPEGPPGRYLCGVSPPADRDPDCHDLDALELVDHDLFEETIWPALYERCEAFGALRVQAAWSGFYEYNTLDQNAIIGRHPHVPSLLLCNGFSGHGLQQSPGAGRAVAELLTQGAYSTVDVSCFGFERVLNGEPLFEQNIV